MIKKKKTRVRVKQILKMAKHPTSLLGTGIAQQQSDPNKMQDVLFSAGTDVGREEALLNSSINASKSQVQTNNAKIPNHLPFLHPEQVSNYMREAEGELRDLTLRKRS